MTNSEQPNRPEEGSELEGGYEQLYQLCLEEARASKGKQEDTKKIQPLVGVVLVEITDEGHLKYVASAHRSEFSSGEHGEYTLLERRTPALDLRKPGKKYTIACSLEPCTQRDKPKVSCSDRIIRRGIQTVHVGMLDPNPKIFGGGVWTMVNKGITVEYFPRNHREQLEGIEINKEFVKEQRGNFSYEDFNENLPKAFVYKKEPFRDVIYGLYRMCPGKIVVLYNTLLNTFTDIHEFQASIAQGLFKSKHIDVLYICVNDETFELLRDVLNGDRDNDEFHGVPGRKLREMLTGELSFLKSSSKKIYIKTLDKNDDVDVKATLFLRTRRLDARNKPMYGIFVLMPAVLKDDYREPPRVFLVVKQDDKDKEHQSALTNAANCALKAVRTGKRKDRFYDVLDWLLPEQQS